MQQFKLKQILMTINRFKIEGKTTMLIYIFTNELLTTIYISFKNIKDKMRPLATAEVSLL